MPIYTPEDITKIVLGRESHLTHGMPPVYEQPVKGPCGWALSIFFDPPETVPRKSTIAEKLFWLNFDEVQIREIEETAARAALAIQFGADPEKTLLEDFTKLSEKHPKIFTVPARNPGLNVLRAQDHE
jgi:hypothetical protein